MAASSTSSAADGQFFSAWGALAFAYAREADFPLPPAPAYFWTGGGRSRTGLTDQEQRAQAAMVRRLAEERLEIEEYLYVIARLSGYPERRKRAMEGVAGWLRGELQADPPPLDGVDAIARQYLWGGWSVRKLRTAMRCRNAVAVAYRDSGFGALDRLHRKTLDHAERVLRSRGLLVEREAA